MSVPIFTPQESQEVCNIFVAGKGGTRVFRSFCAWMLEGLTAVYGLGVLGVVGPGCSLASHMSSWCARHQGREALRLLEVCDRLQDFGVSRLSIFRQDLNQHIGRIHIRTARITIRSKRFYTETTSGQALQHRSFGCLTVLHA